MKFLRKKHKGKQNFNKVQWGKRKRGEARE